MDDALRKRLDAIIALLAVIALLLAGGIVIFGGGDFLLTLLFVGALAGILVRVLYPEYWDRPTPEGDHR